MAAPDFKSLSVFIPELSSKSVGEISSGDKSEYEKVAKELGARDYLRCNVETFQSLNRTFDFVILNLDLHKFTDDEFLSLCETVLPHLEVGGHMFFTANVSQDSTIRSAMAYIDLSQMKVQSEATKSAQYGFELAFAKPFSSTSNTLFEKVSYLWQKQKLENVHGFKSLKEFMDHKQYSRNGVIRYEVIFGSGFVSTGGVDTTTAFLKDLNLKPNEKVLDVGCGIGGGDFLMAENYGVEVLGIDLASNMVGIAWERAPKFQNLNVRFEIGDITKQKFPDEYFDVIYSRDTILHIHDKESLFAQFKKWLKPGGRILITDYCAGPRDKWSSEFATYVEQRGYDLRTVEEYGSLFSKLGFSVVRAVDRTDLFVESLQKELKKMAEIKDKFVSDFSLDDFNYLVEGWNAKLVRCAEGNQRWGYFFCVK